MPISRFPISIQLPTAQAGSAPATTRDKQLHLKHASAEDKDAEKSRGRGRGRGRGQGRGKGLGRGRGAKDDSKVHDTDADGKTDEQQSK